MQSKKNAEIHSRIRLHGPVVATTTGMNLPVTIFLLCITAQADRLEIFADSLITPEEAERASAAMGYGVRVQELDERIAKWSTWDAVSSYVPRVSASSQYLRLGDAGVGFGFSGIGQPVPGGGEPTEGLPGMAQAPSDTSGAPPADFSEAQPDLSNSLYIHEISVQQPIFNGGREIVGLRTTFIRRNAARAADSASRLDAILSARESYFNAVSAQQSLAVVRNSLEFSERNLSEAEIKQENGVLPITDVTRWRAQVAQNRARMALAEAAVESSRFRLLITMGYRLDEVPDSFGLIGVPYFEGQCSTHALSIPESISVSGNPTVRSLKVGTELAEQRKRLSIANYIPSLNGFYARQWTATQGVIPDENGTWYLGLILSVPISVWLSNTPNLKTSAAELRKAQIRETEGMQQLLVSARTFALNYVASTRSLTAAEERRDLLLETVQSMQARYEAGVASQTELLDVALERDRARLAYIEALFDCLLSRARFLRSVGKLEVMK